MKHSFFAKAGAMLSPVVLLMGCSTLTAPLKQADTRWADYETWTKVTELAPSTGNPTGVLGGQHQGDDGYREVYVNDIAKAALFGSAPYDYPIGSVIVKEQYTSKEDWENKRKAQHTISIKVKDGAATDRDKWVWADSLKGQAEENAFCANCHFVAATRDEDFVFTNGDFLEAEKAKAQ